MILKLENIIKTFGDKTVLNQISYDFSSPGLYIIKGKSGGGKSTLLNIIAGFEQVDQGNLIKEDCKISCMFQNFELLNDLTVEENITLNEKIHDTLSEHKEYIIKTLGIDNLLKHYPEELSGGQKQRVSIARSLCSNANVFLCDEPTESLDFRNVKKVMELLTELSKTKVVIVVTHNLSIIDFDKYTVLHMEKGCLTVETDHRNKDTQTTVNNTNGYNQNIVQTYIQKILKKKTQSQILFFTICFIMTLGMFILYGKLFVGDKAPHTVSHDVVYVGTGGMSIPEGTGEEKIIHFEDYSYRSSFFPMKIVPLHNDLSSFQVIGQKEIDGESLIINQNTAQFLMKVYELDKIEELIQKTMTLQYKIGDQKRNLDFKINGIVNEEDVGTYAFVYYDKDAFDNRLKTIPCQDNYSDFDVAYRRTDYYEIVCDKGKVYSSYNALNELKGYDLFNIEITQIEEKTENTRKLKPYYVAMFSVFIVFELIYMIYNNYKDWHYHLSAFAIMISNGADMNEIKKLYMNIKIKNLLKIIGCIDCIAILFDLFVLKKNIWIIFNIYIIVVMALFVISIRIMSKSLRTETIALILKEDKDMK